MTEAIPERPIRTVSVQGRDVTVRKLVDTQLLLMAREAKILSREDVEMDRKLAGIDRMFDILESAVDDDGEREYLESLMVAGKLDLRELISFVTAFDEDEAPKPKVRRGRPPARR